MDVDKKVSPKMFWSKNAVFFLSNIKTNLLKTTTLSADNII